MCVCVCVCVWVCVCVYVRVCSLRASLCVLILTSGCLPFPALLQLVVGDIAALPFDDGAFVLVHDKGTYDAWRLGEQAHSAYAAEVGRVLCAGGVFVLSCVNWTPEELVTLFCDGGVFEKLTTLQGASFQFGGVTGHNVCTVVFKKVFA